MHVLLFIHRRSIRRKRSVTFLLARAWHLLNAPWIHPNMWRKQSDTKENIHTTFNVSKMLSSLILVLLLYIVSVLTTPMILYNNAGFDPINVRFRLIDLFSVPTSDMCICQCYTYSSCATGIYLGINQTCVLFSAHLWVGQLSLITNSLATVFSFSNKTSVIGKVTNYFRE